MRITSPLVLNRRQEARRQKGLPGLVDAAGGPEGLADLMLKEGDEISPTTAKNWAMGRSRPQKRLWASLRKVAADLGVEISLEPSPESSFCGVSGCLRKRNGPFCPSHKKRMAIHGDLFVDVPIGGMGERTREINEDRAAAMRNARAQGQTYAQVAKAFGVSKQRAFQICREVNRAASAG